MRASVFVGRVGGLAVALGVGAVIAVGGAAVAAAAPGEESSAPQATQGAQSADSSGRAGRAGRASAVRNSEARRPAAPREERDRAAARVRAPAPAAGPRRAAVTKPEPARKSDTPSAQSGAQAGAQADAVNPIAALLFNQTPALNPTRTGQDSASVVTGDLNINDPDSDVEVYTVVGEPERGAVEIDADGRYTYTPNIQYARTGTTDSFTVTVSDSESGFHLHGLMGLFNLLTFGLLGDPGHASTTTVNVVVDPRNTAPEATLRVGDPDPATGAVTGTVTGTDADGDPLTYRGPSATAKGTLTVAADGSFTFTPSVDARHDAASLVATAVDKTDTFTITVADEYGGRAPVAVTVAISPLNEAPVAGVSVGSPDPSTGVVTGRVSATDPDGDPLTYRGSGGTAKGVVSVAADGAFVYTPNAVARHDAARLSASVADKTDTFVVTVADDSGGSTTIEVTVAISPTNIAPVAGAVSVGAPDATSGLVNGSVGGSDADGDALSFSATPAKGSASFAGNGSFTFTPSPAARQDAANGGATTDTFIVTIADGHGGTATTSVTVGIAPALAPPAVSFAFSYDGSADWTAEARGALESAAASLGSYFVVSAPVTITISVSGTNSPSSSTLAYASVDFAGSGAGYYGTMVQSKILTGVDPNGGAADAVISYNFYYPWALGNSVPGNQYDFKAVAVHELLHTLGFLTGTGNNPSSTDRNWTTYDSFLTTSDGTRVIADNFNLIGAYRPNFTGGGGGLYFSGPNAVAAYGGRVPLYTPGTFAPGSSVSHVNQLGGYVMNPFSGYGPEPRTLSGVEVAILRDLGYTVNNGPSVPALVLLWFGLRRRKRRAED